MHQQERRRGADAYFQLPVSSLTRRDHGHLPENEPVIDTLPHLLPELWALGSLKQLECYLESLL